MCFWRGLCWLCRVFCYIITECLCVFPVFIFTALSVGLKTDSPVSLLDIPISPSYFQLWLIQGFPWWYLWPEAVERKRVTSSTDNHHKQFMNVFELGQSNMHFLFKCNCKLCLRLQPVLQMCQWYWSEGVCEFSINIMRFVFLVNWGI